MNHVCIKYISTQYHYVRKLMKNNHVKITYVNIKNMIIDDFIESLSTEKFRDFIIILKLISVNKGEKI